MSETKCINCGKSFQVSNWLNNPDKRPSVCGNCHTPEPAKEYRQVRDEEGFLMATVPVKSAPKPAKCPCGIHEMANERKDHEFKDCPNHKDESAPQPALSDWANNLPWFAGEMSEDGLTRNLEFHEQELIKFIRNLLHSRDAQLRDEYIQEAVNVATLTFNPDKMPDIDQATGYEIAKRHIIKNLKSLLENN